MPPKNKYRGFTIKEILNRKTGRREFKVRFQINNKEFYLTDENRKRLEQIIDEVIGQERRAKYQLPAAHRFPRIEEILQLHLERLQNNRKKRALFERVATAFLNLLPGDLKINELKKAHFQKYIDLRLNEINKQSGALILPETVNKELSALSVAFRLAPNYFPELETIPPVQVPKVPAKKTRRERLVEKRGELDRLLEYLRAVHRSEKVCLARAALADDLEIRYETGLRRSEVAALEKNQYRPDEAALIQVRRIKTKTITPFLPLTKRACEIIESRLDSNSKYIFSTNGKPNEGAYRTLKAACAELKISYGTHTPGGFVPHDLRHNFATEIIRVTDIETAKNLTGHTGEHLLTYLHTDKQTMAEAIRRREGFDIKKQLEALYDLIKTDQITRAEFVEKTEKLLKN